jgi:hypothetical protein
MNRIEDKVDWKELVNPPVLWDVRLGIEFGKPNGNNRVYTEEVWKKAVAEAQARINNGEVLVYAGEPTLVNAIASVAEIAINRNEACAGVRFLPTEKGKQFETLIKAGYVNFFTSGVGSVKDGVVQDDYQLQYLTCAPNVRQDREPE